MLKAPGDQFEHSRQQRVVKKWGLSRQIGSSELIPRTCVVPWWYYLVALRTSRCLTLSSERSRVLASFVLARNVKPTPDQAPIDLQREDADTRERLAKAVSFDTVSKMVKSGARYMLTFEGVQTEAQLDGYFEVYLGLPRDGKPDPDSPYYVGNLTLSGTDAVPRHSARGGHPLMRTLVCQSLSM